jgi:hypothetical protein
MSTSLPASRSCKLANDSEPPAAKRREEAGYTADTLVEDIRASKLQHVYAVICETLPRNCVPYSPKEHKEEVLELYVELRDANNRVRKEWEDSGGNFTGWDIEVVFDAGYEMWRAEDYEGLCTGVHVYVKKMEVKGPASEPMGEWKRPLPGQRG